MVKKKETDVLDFNKVINTTVFVLHSSTHDKESATIYPKGSNKGLALWNYPQSGFGKSSISSLVKSKTIPLSFKSSPSRGKLVKTGKGSRLPSLKLNDTPSVASNKTRKRNNDSSLLEINSGMMPTKTPLKDKILPIRIVNKVVDTNSETSSTEGDQDQHWKCKRKKAKYQSSEFIDLDISTIDSEAFSVNDPSSIMPLPELAEQDDFSKLKNGVKMLMEDLKGINVINTSILEGFINTFIKIYEEYDAMKSSSSKKITKENHQKLLSDVQQSLVNIKEENTKERVCMEDLQ
ncbi:hypothetical protein BC332_11341 [Capsicum chinense]|nr:hypothetical protein BC332_11341 [Capsicum chinense]